MKASHIHQSIEKGLRNVRKGSAQAENSDALCLFGMEPCMTEDHETGEE